MLGERMWFVNAGKSVEPTVTSTVKPLAERCLEAAEAFVADISAIASLPSTKVGQRSYPHLDRSDQRNSGFQLIPNSRVGLDLSSYRLPLRIHLIGTKRPIGSKMKASIGRLRYLAARKSSSSSSRSLRLSTTPTTSLTKCPNTTRSPISANSTTQPRSEQRRASTTASTASTSSFSSINADEISHFSRLSSQWWDRTGEFGLLHRMNPARVEYIRRKVALDPDDEPRWTFEDRWKGQERDEGRGTGRWLAGKECLDVGCGGGLLSEVSCP